MVKWYETPPPDPSVIGPPPKPPWLDITLQCAGSTGFVIIDGDKTTAEAFGSKHNPWSWGAGVLVASICSILILIVVSIFLTKWYRKRLLNNRVDQKHLTEKENFLYNYRIKGLRWKRKKKKPPEEKPIKETVLDKVLKNDDCLSNVSEDKGIGEEIITYTPEPRHEPHHASVTSGISINSWESYNNGKHISPKHYQSAESTEKRRKRYTKSRSDMICRNSTDTAGGAVEEDDDDSKIGSPISRITTPLPILDPLRSVLEPVRSRPRRHKKKRSRSKSVSKDDENELADSSSKLGETYVISSPVHDNSNVYSSETYSSIYESFPRKQEKDTMKLYSKHEKKRESSPTKHRSRRSSSSMLCGNDSVSSPTKRMNEYAVSPTRKSDYSDSHNMKLNLGEDNRSQDTDIDIERYILNPSRAKRSKPRSASESRKSTHEGDNRLPPKSETASAHALNRDSGRASRHTTYSINSENNEGESKRRKRKKKKKVPQTEEVEESYNSLHLPLRALGMMGHDAHTYETLHFKKYQSHA